jgi:cytochrome bd-type quinol oxidase subunit 2
MKINWLRSIYIFLSIALGVVSGLFFHSSIHNNSQAINIIVTVFSILSGFLIAIITMIGDSAPLINARSWRALELNRDRFITRLYRHKLLFLLYLSTLVIIFIASLIKGKYPEWYILLEQIFFGLAVTSFALSFSLPFSLINTQVKKYDLLIESFKESGPDQSA